MTTSANARASRELDALVAEKFLKWTLDYEFVELYEAPTVPALRDKYDEVGLLPHLSADLQDTRFVINALRDRGWRVEIGCAGAESWAHVQKARQHFKAETGIGEEALAVCLVALAVAEGRTEEIPWHGKLGALLGSCCEHDGPCPAETETHICICGCHDWPEAWGDCPDYDGKL